jgi:zinc/manganese transport system substrate-binding protein
LRAPFTKWYAPLAVLAVGLLAAGCGSQGASGGSGNGPPGGKLEVVATTTQIGDFVRNVGGEAVDAHQILQPNTDPHEYEPRPQDVEATAGAKVVFENGDNLDRWMGDVVAQVGGDPKVVDLGADVPVKLPGESSGPEASRYDPHWWHDPKNAEAAVGEIRDALAEADPKDAKTYRKNAENYLAKLGKLDKDISYCMDKVPEGERKLVTDHDAFSYFAKRYGVDVVGAIIPSQSTQGQPSAKEVSDLVSLIEREDVKAVFPESSINPELARQIARQTGASADYTLYGDTLGPEGSGGDTYLEMEAHNATAMVDGFTGGKQTCSIPAG